MMKFESESLHVRGESSSQSVVSRHDFQVKVLPDDSQNSRTDIEKDLDFLQSKNRPILYAKMTVVFLALVVSFLCTRSFNSPRRSVDCIRDSVFELTQSVNDKLNTDPYLLRIFQVTSSMVVDFAEITLMITYLLKGTSISFPMQLIVFYAVRGFIQGIFLFGHPQGVIWTDPGIPSLAVPYGQFSDYYFSGHCGFLTMMILEHYRQGNKRLSVFLAVLLPYLAFVLMATRVHFSIDIIVGIMFGTYAHFQTYAYLNHTHHFLQLTFTKHVWRRISYFSEA